MASVSACSREIIGRMTDAEPSARTNGRQLVCEFGCGPTALARPGGPGPDNGQVRRHRVVGQRASLVVGANINFRYPCGQLPVVRAVPRFIETILGVQFVFVQVGKNQYTPTMCAASLLVADIGRWKRTVFSVVLMQRPCDPFEAIWARPPFFCLACATHTEAECRKQDREYKANGKSPKKLSRPKEHPHPCRKKQYPQDSAKPAECFNRHTHQGHSIDNVHEPKGRSRYRWRCTVLRRD